MEPIKIKVMFIDGCVDTVLGNEAALQSKDLQIEIVDYNRDYGERELLDKEYEEKGMSDIPYSITHCEAEDEE